MVDAQAQTGRIWLVGLVPVTLVLPGDVIPGPGSGYRHWPSSSGWLGDTPVRVLERGWFIRLWVVVA